MDIKCVLVTDFEKVCRICMKFDKTFLSINSFKIIDMIVACASVQIWKNDDLPNQICNECFLQLQNAINFKQLCENSDNAFRQIIEQNKINLSNHQNGCDNVKNEEVERSDYIDDNSAIYIKEEEELENIKIENVKSRIVQHVNNSEKSETNKIEDGEMLEIKKEDKQELSRMQTRRKTIQYKFEEDSDGENEDINEKDESEWDNEDEKSDIDNQPHINEYKCDICSGVFKKVDALGLHMQRKHNAEGTKCKKCSLICYHPLHLRAHEKLHNKCRICNLSFSTPKKLVEHKLTHDHENMPEIICKMCPIKLTSKSILYRHMRMIHNIQSVRKCLKCDTCDETFKTKRLLAKHIRKIHPKVKIKYKQQIVNCEICGKSLKRCYLRKHMTTHGERDKIACEYCAKIFISQETLQTHVKIYHKNSGPVCRYLCSECGLKLRSKSELDNHLLTHTRERPYACDKCDKTYRTTFMLKQHISRVHLNERNFVCTFCSQAFYDKKILLNHVRRHTGEKPFKCHMCEKSFIQKAALKVHMKVHTNSM